MAKLLYLGHSSLRIQLDEGKVIYIDPYAGNGYDLVPNFVLVSHEHYDHNNLSLLKIAKDTVIIRAKNCILPNFQYKTFENSYLKVIATPASNQNHSIKECVGFILEFDGIKLYYAGDTSYLPFMKDSLPKLNLDYAFLPCDGVYNMDVKQASECGKLIQAKHIVPIHTQVGSLFSKKVAEEFDCPNKLIIYPNQEIIL